MSKKGVPVFTHGAPGVPSVRVDPSGQVPGYSAYSGAFLGYGSVPYGTMSDAPNGHPNHGKPYHGGIQIDHQGHHAYMFHRLSPKDYR